MSHFSARTEFKQAQVGIHQLAMATSSTALIGNGLIFWYMKLLFGLVGYCVGRERLHSAFKLRKKYEKKS
jgi:hypothetical protein